MNDPQEKPTPREELEMRLTALLMGELPPEEAAALEAQVAADPALAALHARLRKAMELLREASTQTEAPASETPVQLSSERRARLLAHFQTPRPKPPQTVKLARFPHPASTHEKRQRDWSWVIPLGVAATVVALVAIGIGGSVPFRTVTDTPDFSATSGMVTVNPDSDPGALASGEGRPPESFALATSQPQVKLADNSTMSGNIASITTTNVTTPVFSVTPKVPVVSGGQLMTTPVPARPAIETASRGNSAYGSASPATHAMNLGRIETAASAASSAAPAPAPDLPTIYLGNATANVALTAPEEPKPAFATDTSMGDVLTKSGSGNLRLSGANTYTGNTTLNGGTLTVTAGGTLTMNGAFTGASGGSFAFQPTDNTGTIAGAGGAGNVQAKNDETTRSSGLGTAQLLQNEFQRDPAHPGNSTDANFDWNLGRSVVPRTPAPLAEAKPASSPEPAINPATLGNRSGNIFYGGGTVGTAAAGEPVRGKDAKPDPDLDAFANQDEFSKLQRYSGSAVAGNTRTPADARLAAEKPVKVQVERLKEMTDLDEAKKVTESKPAANKAAAVPAVEAKAKARANVEQVKQWFVEAQGLYDTGRFNLAKKRAEQILNVDPNNIAARRFEEKIDRAVSDHDVAAYNETRADAIAKSDMAWARPVRRFNAPIEINSPAAGNDHIRSKMESIIIPKVEFHEATVREVIDFLKRKSVELDDKSPAGEKGTNIVLKLADKEAPGNVPGIPAAAASAPADAADPANARITLSLSNIPLGEALKYVTGLANLKYKVEPYAIALTPMTENTDVLITKEWKVPADLIPKASGADGTFDRTTAKNWLLAQGLSFNGAASAVYIPKTNRLIVRNTQDQLDLVDNIIETSTAEKAEAAAKTAVPALPVPQPEVETRANPFSTFSLNVSDVSFKLAAASLEQNHMPDPATVRSEEFINAFDYRDPEPAAGAPLAFAAERARYPFAQNRDLLRFSVKTAAAGRQPGRPLNIVLLLDKSGSMERADRVNIVREALRVLATQLQPQDKLSIVTFARTPRLWADGVAGDKVTDTIARVSEITPEGGTNLEAALDLGYATALKHYTVGSINRVVLFTDGAANLGDVDPEALTKKVEAQRKKGVALDCFGIGWEGFNDDLLEQLTRNADGRYGFINTPEEAAENFALQLAGALRVAASDVKVQVEFNPRRVKAYRQVGYAKHQLTKEQFRDNTVNAAQIGAAESGNALYVVEVDPRGEGDLATVRVRFRDPGTSDYHEHEWAVPFSGEASPLEQASSALRLAGAASAFSEMLANNPYAAEVTSDRLLSILSGVPPIYGADPRPTKLEWMIRQARSLSNR